MILVKKTFLHIGGDMIQGISRRSLLRSFTGGVTAGIIGSGMAGQALGSSLVRSKSRMHPEKVLLWENTRREIRELLESGDLKAAILPTGSIEQHNEHLALVQDIAQATLISKLVALELYPQVIVAPPSPCGYAPYWMSRKGTITLRRETFQAYVFDVLHSLKTHGIRTLLVLNGHGGNHTPLKEAEEKWRKELGVTLEVDSFWRGIPKEFVDRVLTSKERLSHADEFETSIALAGHPKGRVRRITMKQYDDAKLDYESGFSPDVEHFLRIDHRTFRNGKIDEEGENKLDRGRQRLSLFASAEKGEALISKATDFFVEKMKKMIAATEAGQSWPLK